jgi:hypothetical protein
VQVICASHQIHRHRLIHSLGCSQQVSLLWSYAGLDHDGVTNKPTLRDGVIDEGYYSGPEAGLEVAVPVVAGASLLLFDQIPWAPIMVSWQATRIVLAS